MGKISDVVKPGVVTGSDLQFIFKVAKENQFAIPAVNVVGSSTVNAILEAAKIGSKWKDFCRILSKSKV